MPRSSTQEPVAELCARLRAAAGPLQALGLHARAERLAAAAALLRTPELPLARSLRSELLGASGLSAALIEWGLQTTLRRFSAPELLALAAQAEPLAAPGALAVAVLAGNVFSAAARPLLLPLLCGVPCLARGSSRDDAFARHLALALADVSVALGDAVAVLCFPRSDLARQAALFSHASVVSLYGSDSTIAELSAHVPPGVTLLSHGHGLGVALVEHGGDREAARALARDVSAYDQRGCLSPHAIFVLDDAPRFARELHAALGELEPSWPRGPLPPAAAAEQLQWRGVAAVRGELHAHAAFAVSFEGDSPLRASCGYRNVGVYRAASVEAFAVQARALGPHLKALGSTSPARVQGLAPYTCELGAMQDPPLSARLDGLHPLAGFASQSE
jgi:acyl-CoA reductase-like NAD-dependent aldehyde dehydrogenase